MSIKNKHIYSWLPFTRTSFILSENRFISTRTKVFRYLKTLIEGLYWKIYARGHAEISALWKVTRCLPEKLFGKDRGLDVFLHSGCKQAILWDWFFTPAISRIFLPLNAFFTLLIFPSVLWNKQMVCVWFWIN